MSTITETRPARVKVKKPIVQNAEKLIKPKAEYDTPYKEILNLFFKDFMELCWPELYEKINWQRPYKVLDNELNKIVRNASIKNKLADKLIEVWLITGEEVTVLVHLEVQGRKEIDFEERMFIYYIRIFERYRKPVASLAILMDGNHRWRPNTFKQGLPGTSTSIEFKFGVLKILEFLDKKSELEASNNRFSTAVLAQLAVLEKGPHNAKLDSKIGLIRRLFRKDWGRDDIVALFNFIDWVLALPKSYEEKFREEIVTLEKEMNVQYVNTFERHGIEKGIQQGIDLGIQQGIDLGIQQGIDLGKQQGEGAILLRLLQHKFKGKLADSYYTKIQEASTDTLLIWAERVLDSDNLEEIFKV